MLKKEVAFVDFDGNEQTETLYFNLTEPEVVRLDVGFPGGLKTFVEQIDPVERPQEVLELFEAVIRSSYGKKSDDGRYFNKPEEETKLFMESAVYGALFMELLQDADVAGAFFTGILTQTTVDTPSKTEPIH